VTSIYACSRGEGEALLAQYSGYWQEFSLEPKRQIVNLIELLRHYGTKSVLWGDVSTTGIAPQWSEFPRILRVTTSRVLQRQLLVSKIGWSKDEALETRMRLRSFEEDWNAPGMEGYDDV
jgi:hypothetical protein